MKYSINSQNTKIILAETLVSLLEKKPISKITISELVTLCEINRKTFYYHFTDVYDLLEWHLNSEIQKAITTIRPLDDFNTAIDYSMEYMKKNTYLRNCIENPLGRDKIVQFLNKNLYSKAGEMLSELEERYHKDLKPDFKKFLTKSLTHITVLSIIDAIENPDEFYMQEIKLYLSDIYEASLEVFFKKT